MLSKAALSQETSTPTGPKFQRAGQRSGSVSIPPPKPECDFISHNLSFCTANTDWVLEREPIHGEQALYKLSNTHRASLIVIPMKEDASLKLSPAEASELLNRHVFLEGPRGRMEIGTIVEEERTPSGSLLNKRAFVTDSSGQSHLLQVTILTFDYGLGLLETTIAMPTTKGTRVASENDLAFHQEFLERTMVSISILGAVDLPSLMADN